ncbi:hypothetical protein BMW24_021450 [Mycobacterium heckeshornense]|uniref:Uncharacterized protein n=1 Tax=Mycobacterium heckeshornense TaxID=110505 RepID=A0A2G8B059_9MYCO|nr:hypothetical protein [Mycobacterium heckeshornense]KMV22538.1 hypothetical protein ACT16_10785 [Mycobacterium heckeshornense]MCV7034628.1 hypothetical protein [Mycobacterium heckeshornense]PIJ31016.1 hypothetical protein BMW24_021450 [Mycobacterium heckeshornense]BCO33879.1 hypothetical protein MHEC_03120 [Mycobacterium heckeshornense]BCQ06931.1 hypothetical protein JMUB5695_00345 [Mycobacterium heckeshornense]
MPASWAWRHPTLVDLAQRREAIGDWEAMDRGGRRLARQISVTCFALALVAGITAMVAPAVSSVAAVSTGLLLMASVLCVRVWWGDPPVPGSRRQPPAHPGQMDAGVTASPAPEQFRTVCVCPGCGVLAAHLFRPPGEGDPGRAALIRQCAACQREWAQP